MSGLEKHTINNLLNDDSFIVWVKSNFKTNNQYWSGIKPDLNTQEVIKFDNAIQILVKLNNLNIDNSHSQKSREFVDQQFNLLLEASKNKESNNPKVFKLTKFFKYAAAIILLISISSVLLLSNNSIYKFEDNLTETAYNTNDILILTPENKHFKITKDTNKKWLINNGVTVSVTGEKISFTLNNGETSDDTNEFKIIVPEGKKYQLQLIDGSEVQLNSNSIIAFNNSNVSANRKIDLEGEAFFDVTHNKNRPFIVQSSDMKIEVLGTVFNVSNYMTNDYTSTTLINGSIKVYNPQGENETIKPGHQVKLFHNQNRIIVDNVNIQEKISWTRNKIIFKNNKLEYAVTSPILDLNIKSSFNNENESKPKSGFLNYNSSIYFQKPQSVETSRYPNKKINSPFNVIRFNISTSKLFIV